MEEDDIIRNLLKLESNVLNLLKSEDSKKQIQREIRYIVEIGRRLKGEIRRYELEEKDHTDYVNALRLLKEENRELKRKTDTDDEEGVVLNIIHDIQTTDEKTFSQLKKIVEEKNIKINQLEQTNIDFKAENNRLKMELILSKLPGYVTKFKKGSEIETMIMKLEKQIYNLTMEYRTTSNKEIKEFKQKEIDKKKRELEYFKTYREAGYEYGFFEVEYE